LAEKTIIYRKLTRLVFLRRDRMHRKRTLALLLVVALAASILIGCTAGSEEPAVPAATAESSSNTDPAPEIQIPAKSSEVPRMTVEELQARLDDGQQIMIVDTRNEAQYEREHIAGAIWLPSVDLESPLDELALDHEIVLYCA
jgi:hypothetical protein